LFDFSAAPRTAHEVLSWSLLTCAAGLPIDQEALCS
jgi:hypothetical protein